MVSPASGAAAALVLVLHGANQNGKKVRDFSGRSFDRLAEDASALVVYPNAYKGHWNDARRTNRTPARSDGVDDTAFLATLIDQQEALPTYVVGYSTGGQMAIRLVHEIPDRLCGAVIIGGTLDPVVPYGGGIASMWGLRSGGSGLSAHDSAQYFALRNGVTAAPMIERLSHRVGSGPTSVIRQRWAQAGSHSVTLYTVANGGHVIPNPVRRASPLLGRTTCDINAADVVADLMAESLSRGARL